jgi:hypothetical protein
MTSDETTGASFVRFLLDKVRQDPYPSREQLDLIEESIPPEMVPDYVQVLIDKAAESEFPSNDMLRRIQRMSSNRRPPTPG